MQAQAIKTNDKSALARERRVVKWRGARDKEDLRWILEDVRGRRVLQRIMAGKCAVYNDIALNGAETHAAIGMRRVGVWLRGLIKDIGPAFLTQMEAEYEDERDATASQGP